MGKGEDHSGWEHQTPYRNFQENTVIYPGVPHKRHLLQVREHFRGLEVLPKKFLIVFDGPLGDD